MGEHVTKDIIQSVYFLPVLWVLKFIDNYYIPVILMGITVFIYCSSYADKWASRIKDLTKEYQRAALRQLIDEKQKVYIKTESIEGEKCLRKSLRKERIRVIK